MLINFIGLAFLCGVGLGGFIVVILIILRKATPQRTKWAMLGSASFATLIAVVLTLYVVLGTRQEEQLQQSFQSISDLDQAVQWYKYTYSSSSATGKCGSTSTHRWFGLNDKIERQTIIDWYDRQLVDDGWQSENTVWRKDSSQGIFTFNVEVFTDAAMIDSGQGYYRIPNEALQQSLNYQTVYVLRLHLISHESLARCFKQ